MYWIAFPLRRHPKNEMCHLQTPKTGGVVYAAYDLGKETSKRDFILRGIHF